jgi:hypothetical protein
MQFRIDPTLPLRSLCWCGAFAIAVATIGYSQSQPAPAVPAVPTIGAELGSCSVQFTVQDGAGKPVSGATMRVRIAYGFMSVRKLDLETSTNSEGKVRFEGLPGNLRRALFFRASKDKLEGTAFYDPAKNCSAQHTIVMVPKKDEPENNDTPEDEKGAQKDN